MSDSSENAPSSREELATEGLRSLIDQNEPEGDYVPGRGTVSVAPRSLEIDFRALAAALLRDAEQHTSALAKSRSLLVASRLFLLAGDKQRAFDAARVSAETSPKLAVAAQLLRQHAQKLKEPTVVERTLETTLRQAVHEASRRHALLQLAQHLAREERVSELGHLLDQAARSGEKESAILLGRIIHRVSQGTTLSGVELPERYRDSVLWVQELLEGAEGTAPEKADPKDPVLAVVRAARLFSKGQINEAVALLSSAGVAEDNLAKMRAALHLAERGGLEAALAAQKGALSSELTLRAQASRSTLRSLAALSLAAGQVEILATVLDHADPGTGTFSLEERWLLSARAGAPLAVTEEEAASLSGSTPLALVLGPEEVLAHAGSEATDDVLLAQLGQGLARLREPSASVLTEPGTQALQELRERSAAPEVCSALDLAQGRASRDSAALAVALARLARETEQAEAALVSGALLQHTGQTDQAALSYHQAMNKSQLRHSAEEGLRSLGEALATDIAQAPDLEPELAFAHSLLSSRQLPLSERAQALLEATATLTAAVPFDTQLPGLAFAATLFAESRSPGSKSELLDARLRASSSVVGQLKTLRQFLTPELGQVEHGQLESPPPNLLASKDRSVRILAQFCEPASPGGLARRTGSEEPGARIHELLTFARDFVTMPATAREVPTDFAALDPIGDDVARDCARMNPHSSALSGYYLDRAKSEGDAASRRYAYERLAALDAERGDTSSERLWIRTLAEEFPEHLPSLLRSEEEQLSQGGAPPVDALAEVLTAEDRNAYFEVRGAEALANSDLRSAKKYLEPLLGQEQPSLLVLRGLASVAREKRDDGLLVRSLGALSSRASTDLDRSALELDRAHAFSRLGAVDSAREAVALSLEARSDSFAARMLENYLLREQSDPIELAERLEAFALCAHDRSHKAELWLLTSEAWDRAQDPERATLAYGATLDTDFGNQKAFERLVSLLEAASNHAELETRIQARLGLIVASSPEALELRLKLARLLLAAERPDESKTELEKALTAHPESIEALRAHAEISAELGEHASAEKSLLALRHGIKDKDQKRAILRSLAKLYHEHLGNVEKAMDAYQEIHREDPEDREVSSTLVQIYCSLGLAERATTLQTDLIKGARTPEEKKLFALKLSEIYETVAKDVERAGATLERTRAAYPLDAATLEATVLFMDRHNTAGPRGFLLDRASKDARRKLEAGRLDAALLDTLARVARLSGNSALADSTENARAAFLGITSEPLKGAGLAALDPRVDDLISPKSLPAPLRLLLRKTGAAMDAAFSVDLSRLGARPLTSGATFERFSQIAQALGGGLPELYVSDSLGAKCFPITTEPARLLVGAGLDALEERERDYLLLRAIKLRWLGLGALSRSKDEDRWPMLVALLHLFAPSWRPPQVDARKAAQAKALIEQGLARVGYDDDVPMLALEAIGSLSPQAETFGQECRTLANRTALLGVGDLAVALAALAASEGSSLKPGGPSRFRYIEAQAEAKDLVLFASTEACAKSRVALGVAEETQRSLPGGPSAGAPTLSRAAIPNQTAEPGPGGPPPPPRRPPPPKRS